LIWGGGGGGLTRKGKVQLPNSCTKKKEKGKSVLGLASVGKSNQKKERGAGEIKKQWGSRTKKKDVGNVVQEERTCQCGIGSENIFHA